MAKKAASATSSGQLVGRITQVTGGSGNDTLQGNSSGNTIFVASLGLDSVTTAGGTNSLNGRNITSLWSVNAPNANWGAFAPRTSPGGPPERG